MLEETTPKPLFSGDVVVYDYETTGTNVWHDQALQFGAVEADGHLNVTRTHDIRIRRLPYVIPHPQALDVTGTNVGTIDGADRLTEFEATRRIERIVKPPYGQDRRVVYFNGLSFDETLTRASFYRNLLDPYVSSLPGVRRIDVRNLAELAVARDPKCLETMGRDEGGASFRLEDLCRVNGIDIDAHDAMHDSVATLDLMRMIVEANPWAFSVVDRVGSSRPVQTHLATLFDDPRPAYLFTHFGRPELMPCAIVQKMGDKRWLAIDLRADLGEIVDAMSDLDQAFSRDNMKDCPVREIVATKCPMLLSPDEAESFASTVSGSERGWLSPKKARERVGSLLPEIARRQVRAERSPFEGHADPTSEETLYTADIGRSDKDLRKRFHATSSWIDRSEIRFENPALRDFAARILVSTASEDDLVRHSRKVEMLRNVCREAYERPFSPDPEARWSTLQGVSTIASSAYRAWVDRHFDMGEPEVELAPAPPHRKAEQLAFGF